MTINISIVALATSEDEQQFDTSNEENGEVISDNSSHEKSDAIAQETNKVHEEETEEAIFEEMVLTEDGRIIASEASNQDFSNADNDSNRWNNFIGIGGIIATFASSLLSVLLTWAITRKPDDVSRLTYSIDVLPLLSGTASQNSTTWLDKLQIIYNGEKLVNPFLLFVDVANTGSKAIINPNIKIETEKNIHVIPGYFENMPNGYETLWSIKEVPSTPSTCEICLGHINPGQVAHIRFFLDNMPKEKPKFISPNADLQTQEVTGESRGVLLNAPPYIAFFTKSNFALTVISVILFVSMNFWYNMLDNLFWGTSLRGYMNATQTCLYIMSLLVLTIFFNVVGIRKVDDYIKASKKNAFILNVVIAIPCVIIAALIILNIVSSDLLQIIFGIITIIGFSIVLHGLCIKDLYEHQYIFPFKAYSRHLN